MYKDHRFCVMLKRDLDHLPDINPRLVDGASGQRFLGNQSVSVVEAQLHEMFDRFMGKACHAVMLDCRPTCQQVLVLNI